MLFCTKYIQKYYETYDIIVEVQLWGDMDLAGSAQVPRAKAKSNEAEPRWTCTCPLIPHKYAYLAYLAYLGTYLGATNRVKHGVPKNILHNVVQTC